MKTEKNAESPAPDETVRYWRGEIERAGRAERDWVRRAEKTVERYRAEKRADGQRRFNILWANTEILKPVVYSRTPAPDVRRRWLDDDPAGREAAAALERALSYLVDDGGFDAAMEAVRDDMLLPGRGVARIVYEPVIARRELERADGGDGEIFLLDGRPVEPDGFDGETPYAEEVVDERVHCRHVFWKDYREQPARCWDEVGWIAFRHSLARTELVERFGAVGREIPLDAAVGPDDRRERGETAPEDARRAVLWEIWHKPARPAHRDRRRVRPRRRGGGRPARPRRLLPGAGAALRGQDVGFPRAHPRVHPLPGPGAGARRAHHPQAAPDPGAPGARPSMPGCWARSSGCSPRAARTR